MSVYRSIRRKTEFNSEDWKAVGNLKDYVESQGFTFEEREDLHHSDADFYIRWNSSNAYSFGLKRNISGIFDWVRKCSNLTRISIHNTVETLDWLCELRGLLALSLWNFDSEIDMQRLSNLEYWASSNTIQYISLHNLLSAPSFIRQFKELRKLAVSNSIVTFSIPDWLVQLPKLEELDFTFSTIERIPYSIVETGLPFVINTSDIPNSGRFIDLRGASLKEGDISLFGQTREVIEEYYQNLVKEVDSECKVIFLGDGAAGKSSLIERIVHDTFADGMLPTDGVKMTRWTAWPDKDKTPLQLGGKSLVLRLMDFGGQEIMHAMHRCFLTAHTVYVVVCESRNDSDIDSIARRWVETVQSFAPDCPVIIALNKSDLNIQVTVDETALRKSNPGFLGAIRTSAKLDGDPGVKQLVEYIFKAIPDCLSQLTANKGFLDLKQELEMMEENYILPDKFRERCNHYAIKETVQTDLLNWFRDLGVAYPYMSTFREVYVLNPAWLTNGIYRLINRTPPTGFLPHSVIRETLGTGYANDVNPDKTYTPQEMDFILHVMRQFEISLCVTPEYTPDGVEMIPMKMEKNTPERVDGFSYAAALHLRWEATYLPNTLVHRLMIRRHEDLDMDCVWRTGGWFHRYDGSCELLVIMTDQALDVYASGIDAREYMSLYREQILRILEELNITAKEYIYCTVNGKTDRIPYEHVLALRKRGRDEIYLGDIDEFVSVDWLLRENYVEKTVNTKRPIPVEKIGEAKRPNSARIEARDFFISYNNDHNGEKARWIANTLRDNGYTVFFQEYDCKPGMDFLRWMDDAISHSRGFLAVWSEAYEKSDFCKDELHAAKMRKHRDGNYLLLPVRVENVAVQNLLFQSVVRVDLLSDDGTNRDRLLSAAKQIRHGTV